MIYLPFIYIVYRYIRMGGAIQRLSNQLQRTLRATLIILYLHNKFIYMYIMHRYICCMSIYAKRKSLIMYMFTVSCACSFTILLKNTHRWMAVARLLCIDSSWSSVRIRTSSDALLPTQTVYIPYNMSDLFSIYYIKC